MKKVRKHQSKTVNLTRRSYNDRFGIGTNLEKQKEALKQALDIRKFEIELYWKRATYFWTFIAAIFAGYFLIQSTDAENDVLLFLLSCIGLIFSISWFLVNRGSKFWQNNWERHVDFLEDDIQGPLYKTIVTDGNLSFWKVHKEYNYSVSKINQLLSIYVSVIWLMLGAMHATSSLKPNWISIIMIGTTAQTKIIFFGLFTLAFILILLKFGKTDPIPRTDSKEKGKQIYIRNKY
jgi:hypothetical protein